MRNILMLAVVVCSTALGSCPGEAQQLLERYQALLSERDHFNSSGQRLTTAAAIIRQDRANYHLFGLRDPGDEDDRIFANVDNRAALERMLERGRSGPGVVSRIVNGAPFVRVEVWSAHDGPYVVVTLIEPPSAGNEEAKGANSPPPSASSAGKTPNANETKSGTGFYVSDDGYLITNEHVIDSCNAISVIGPAEQRIPASLVRASKSDDLALLKTNTRPLVAATFESTRISQGATVVTYGYPLAGLLASSGNVSSGLVTALSGLDDNPRQMQISAPVQPGNSGGPLVDAKGAVVGVVVAKLNALAVARITKDIPQNINFAIKASSVIDLLDANSVRYRTDAPQSDLSVEALTELMKAYTVRIECRQ